MYLVSPTEPEKIKQLGKVSLLPEQYGADVLFSVRRQLIGVQRKAFPDLLASLFDGRLGKEVTQMKRLRIAVLIIEGRPRWTLDGELLDDNRRITRNQLRSLLWTIAISHGVVVEWTDSVDDTVSVITNLWAWAAKKKHLSVVRRPGPSGPWGKATTKDWAVFFLQGLPNIGPELAERIYETFRGIPMRWTVEKKELMRVPGIGEQKARTLWEIFERNAGREKAGEQARGNGRKRDEKAKAREAKVSAPALSGAGAVRGLQVSEREEVQTC